MRKEHNSKTTKFENNRISWKCQYTEKSTHRTRFSVSTSLFFTRAPLRDHARNRFSLFSLKKDHQSFQFWFSVLTIEKFKRQILWNTFSYAVFNADSEYHLEKKVKLISRDLWSIFDFFDLVEVFQSTTTPLEKKIASR